MFALSSLAIITLIMVIAVVAVVIAGEITLLRKKKYKTVLVLIAVVFCLLTALAQQSAYQYNGLSFGGIVISADDQEESLVGELETIIKGKNQVIGFGFLKLTTGNSSQYIALEFDKQGNLIGSKEALPYKEAIVHSLKQSSCDKKLRGKSMTKDQMEDLSQKGERKQFKGSLLVKWLLILHSLTLVLVALYMADWIKRQRDRKAHLMQTKIQDL